MITTDAHLKQTQTALAKLESAMAALKKKKDTTNPERFALMAEPILDHIQQLRSEIDAYTGISQAQAEHDAMAKSHA